jgi:hypothetical protein
MLFAQASTSITSYLPPTLQLVMVYWIAGFCVAIVGLLKKLPPRWSQPWIIQSTAQILGALFGILLVGHAGYIYGAATGVIAAWGATSFYDLIFGTIQRKVESLFGSTPQPPIDTSVPRPTNPDSISTKSNP